MGIIVAHSGCLRREVQNMVVDVREKCMGDSFDFGIVKVMSRRFKYMSCTWYMYNLCGLLQRRAMLEMEEMEG